MICFSLGFIYFCGYLVQCEQGAFDIFPCFVGHPKLLQVDNGISFFHVCEISTLIKN